MTAGGDLEASVAGLTAASLFAAGHLKWTRYGPGKLGAFVAEMDYGTAPAVTAALHDAVDAQRLGYLPPAVADDMRRACAAYQADVHGWPIDPGSVVPLPDVLTGLELAVEHTSAPGSAVIVPTPAYAPFLALPLRLGRAVIEVEMVVDGGRWTYDLDALDRAFAAGGGLLVLCNPHNPLGRVMGRDELEAIAAVVDRHGGRVFADEVHAPLVHPGHVHVPYASISATAAGHTLTGTSAAKAWNLAGLRCAQLIASNDADRAVVDAVVATALHGPSTLGVVATTAAYRHGRAWLAEVVTYLDGNRRLLAELLAEHLPAVGYSPPEGTYLAWLDCRALELPQPVADFFDDEADVVTVDGRRCGAGGAGFVRFNMATSRGLLAQMVTRMGGAVAARSRRPGSDT